MSPGQPTPWSVRPAVTGAPRAKSLKEIQEEEAAAAAASAAAAAAAGVPLSTAPTMASLLAGGGSASFRAEQLALSGSTSSMLGAHAFSGPPPGSALLPGSAGWLPQAGGKPSPMAPLRDPLAEEVLGSASGLLAGASDKPAGLSGSLSASGMGTPGGEETGEGWSEDGSFVDAKDLKKGKKKGSKGKAGTATGLTQSVSYGAVTASGVSGATASPAPAVSYSAKVQPSVPDELPAPPAPSLADFLLIPGLNPNPQASAPAPAWSTPVAAPAASAAAANARPMKGTPARGMAFAAPPIMSLKEIQAAEEVARRARAAAAAAAVAAGQGAGGGGQAGAYSMAAIAAGRVGTGAGAPGGGGYGVVRSGAVAGRDAAAVVVAGGGVRGGGRKGEEGKGREQSEDMFWDVSYQGAGARWVMRLCEEDMLPAVCRV